MPQTASCSVLMFHGVGEAGHPFEPLEETYWIGWEQFDAILDLCADLPPERCWWTFDDGNISDLEAARRMRARGLGGSFFVLMGRIGTPGYLTRDGVRELRDLGMEVGLHGRDHVDWRRTDDRTLRSEIDDAREELAELLGEPVETVAIPYGLYDRRVWGHLQRSSFRRIYTSDRGRARPGDRFVRREAVMRWHHRPEIEAILADRASPLAKMRRAVMPRLKRLR
jgi:peptidoglycan/xylan/chitin deacetylase (PgdA/CDA1 family)